LTAWSGEGGWSDMGQEFRVKGWDKFQHFKDRRPPWIKLYRDILDDIEWHELDPAAAKSLVMIWLIASENDGALPSVRKLSFRLRQSETEVSSTLTKLSHWLEQVDINVISERYQDDLPETETETETEHIVTSGAGDPCPHHEIIAAYHEALPTCTPVKIWGEQRRGLLRQRWREDAKRQRIEWWRRFFAYVAESRFLTGRAENEPGRDPFVADLEWLIRPRNFVKVIEGKYHREEAAA